MVTPGTRQRELWIALVIVVLDQAVKALVRGHVALNESVTVVPGFFDLTRVHNTGTAFGFMNGVEFPFKTIILACVAVAALAGVALYTISLPYEQRLARTGLALIIGGAAGNLIDRVLAGSVVDFVDVYWRAHHFWAFNVADSAISVGVAIMILDMLGVGSRSSSI